MIPTALLTLLLLCWYGCRIKRATRSAQQRLWGTAERKKITHYYLSRKPMDLHDL
jgi:hypothetical protein